MVRSDGLLELTCWFLVRRATRARSQLETQGDLVISSKVFVGNLNFKTTQDRLAGLFGEAGSVVDIYLPADRVTGRPRGFAFVEFANEAEAAEAIEKFHEYELDGRRLNVNPAESRPRKPAPRPPRSFDNNFRSSPGDAPSPRPAKPKGSRRGMRGRKRSL